MPFQVIVREVKYVQGEAPTSAAAAELNRVHSAATSFIGLGYRSDQIYEQTVDQLDLNRVIAAVNHKPRVRKPRQVTASPTPRT